MTDSRSETISAAQVLDLYFLETRAKLLEIAATLDRLDRAGARGAANEVRRVKFIHAALKVLDGEASNRTELIQRLYSNE